MKKPDRKQIIFILSAIIILILIIYGFMPGAEQVETAQVEAAYLQVTVEEEGETFVKDLYTISSPVAAYLNRIHLEAGDFVEAGQELATLRSPQSSPLDSRTQAEAAARVEAARSSLGQAEIRAEQAMNERNRIERLANNGSATRQQLEQAQTDAAQATSALQTARAELRAAQALISSYDNGTEISGVVRAPVSGQILSLHRKSEGPVNPGEPLFDIGDTDSLEVRIDVLSQDAVRIAPGMRVELGQWGGQTVLNAVVTRVEKQGKVMISALGVEERRVQVIAEIESPSENLKGVGSGYRVMARFIIWEDEDVLQVPEAALFRTDDGWAVFAVEDGRAVRKEVSIGRQAGLQTQILEGLAEGETVIVHPGRTIEDGVKVETD